MLAACNVPQPLRQCRHRSILSPNWPDFKSQKKKRKKRQVECNPPQLLPPHTAMVMRPARGTPGMSGSVSHDWWCQEASGTMHSRPRRCAATCMPRSRHSCSTAACFCTESRAPPLRVRLRNSAVELPASCAYALFCIAERLYELLGPVSVALELVLLQGSVLSTQVTLELLLLEGLLLSSVVLEVGASVSPFSHSSWLPGMKKVC